MKVYHSFSFKEQASFNFIAVVTIHSDSGAQEETVGHRSHFPFIRQEALAPSATSAVLNAGLWAIFLTLLCHPYQEAFDFLFTFCH